MTIVDQSYVQLQLGFNPIFINSILPYKIKIKITNIKLSWYFIHGKHESHIKKSKNHL